MEAQPRAELHIFAAASLAPFLDEAKQQYEEKTGQKLILHYAGTHVLRTQIEQRAPAEILFAAQESDVIALQEQGLVQQYLPFAKTELIVLVSKEKSKEIVSMNDLTKKNVRLVLGEEGSPIGMYSRQALKNAEQSGDFGHHFYRSVMENLVSNEHSEPEVITKVRLGEADAGMAYRSSLNEENQKDLHTFSIPSDYAVQPEYFLVKLTTASKEANEFFEWLQSEESETILAKHHFQPY